MDSMEPADRQKGASTSTTVTIAAAFEKRKTTQPSKAKLDKLRTALQNLRWVLTVGCRRALLASVLQCQCVV